MLKLKVNEFNYAVFATSNTTQCFKWEGGDVVDGNIMSKEEKRQVEGKEKNVAETKGQNMSSETKHEHEKVGDEEEVGLSRRAASLAAGRATH